MDIFESLENINVSEGCFEDIVGIVEEYIHEILVGTDEYGRKVDPEKGAGAKDFYDGQYSMKRALKKHFAPKLRGQAKHAIKANKGREKQAKQLYDEGEQQDANTEKVSNAYRAQIDKDNQVWKNWKEANTQMPGTDAESALFKDWCKQTDKKDKLKKKVDKERGKGNAIVQKKGELFDNAYADEEKRQKAADLGFGPNLKKGQYRSNQNIYGLLYHGKK